ncbi:hypothetical protein BC835DRAFT_1244118, partial [Cytidiella melzeri]
VLAMVNRRISDNLKKIAYSLWAAGWDQYNISNAIQVSTASLYHWLDNFYNYGTVSKSPSPLRRRPRLIARAVLTKIHLLLEGNPDTNLDELVW